VIYEKEPLRTKAVVFPGRKPRKLPVGGRQPSAEKKSGGTAVLVGKKNQGPSAREGGYAAKAEGPSL